MKNNEQKSKFIGNISAQIEPSLNTIDEATKETISTPILHENIKALERTDDSYPDVYFIGSIYNRLLLNIL